MEAVNYTDMGQRIKETRQNQGLSQERFAELVITSVSYINRIEAGQSKPRLSTMIRIADTLGASIDELLYGKATQGETTDQNNYTVLLEDCSMDELSIIVDTLKALKKSLREKK